MKLKQLLFMKAAAGEPESPNLLDVTNTSKTYGITEGALSNGVIDDQSIGSGNSDFLLWGQEFPAGTYTFSCKHSGEGLSGTRFLCTKEFSGGVYISAYTAYYKDIPTDEITITMAESFSIGIVLLTGTVGSPGKVYDIQFEIGDHKTPYVPYKG